MFLTHLNLLHKSIFLENEEGTIKVEEKRIKDIIELSSEITGSLASAALGLLGPLGTLAGSMGAPIFTKLLQNIGTEIYDRKLSKREVVRVGAVLTYTTIKINEKINAGEKLRDDGFFEDKVNSLSDADEITEGVLITAQREHEEIKIVYYSNLLANIAFDKTISKDFANQLIKIGQQLSYNQLCLLNIFNNMQLYSLRNSDYSEFAGKGMPFDLINALYQIMELVNLNLVSRTGVIVLQIQNIAPSEMHCFGIGNVLYKNMLLNEIPYNDISRLVSLLT
jgi:hypothetical protein